MSIYFTKVLFSVPGRSGVEFHSLRVTDGRLSVESGDRREYDNNKSLFYPSQ